MGLIWPLRGHTQKDRGIHKSDWFTLALNQGLEKCFGGGEWGRGGGGCVEFLLNGDKKGFGAWHVQRVIVKKMWKSHHILTKKDKSCHILDNWVLWGCQNKGGFKKHSTLLADFYPNWSIPGLSTYKSKLKKKNPLGFWSLDSGSLKLAFSKPNSIATKRPHFARYVNMCTGFLLWWTAPTLVVWYHGKNPKKKIGSF